MRVLTFALFVAIAALFTKTSHGTTLELFDQPSETKTELAKYGRIRGAIKNVQNEFSDLEITRRLKYSTIKFYLRDSRTGKKIADLKDGTVIRLEKFGISSPERLNIEAEVKENEDRVGFVRFELNSSNISFDDTKPYSLCGNNGKSFFTCPGMTLGSHVLTAVPFTRRGDALGPDNVVTFQILSSSPPPPTTTSPVVRPVVTPSPTQRPITTRSPTRKPVSSSPTQRPVASSPTRKPNPPPVPPPTTSPVVRPIATPSPTQRPIATRAPTQKPASRSPTQNPVALSPTRKPNPSPVPPPTTSPIVRPIVTPSPTQQPIAIRSPSQKPASRSPTQSPVATSPTRSPRTSFPTQKPINPTTLSPVSMPNCSVPKFIGNWEAYEPYPIPIAESAGGLVGTDFVVVSGFTRSFSITTSQVFALNISDPSAKWREMDPVPIADGLSHAAVSIVGRTMYLCGGYVGPTPGPDTTVCLMYSHNKPPTQQWSFLPPLPEGRGGGGLLHINSTNSLVFATGAARPNGKATDFSTTWQLDLNNLIGGWVRRADLPFKANHVSHVTATFQGKQRHYIFGGQQGSNETNGNFADNFEWDSASLSWIRRASMNFPRGHTSSSTAAYGCGFITAGGAVNGGTKKADISYYGIDTDSWTSIGDLPEPLNTPVCDIVRFSDGIDYFYCQTGKVGKTFSWRRRISL